MAKWHANKKQKSKHLPYLAQLTQLTVPECGGASCMVWHPEILYPMPLSCGHGWLQSSRLLKFPNFIQNPWRVSTKHQYAHDNFSLPNKFMDSVWLNYTHSEFIIIKIRGYWSGSTPCDARVHSPGSSAMANLGRQQVVAFRSGTQAVGFAVRQSVFLGTLWVQEEAKETQDFTVKAGSRVPMLPSVN